MRNLTQVGVTSPELGVCYRRYNGSVTVLPFSISAKYKLNNVANAAYSDSAKCPCALAGQPCP